ncbi:uncharacterized protein [Nicotiana sylvestris]|uniref:uncharacterized protein n=1 Tax=Nicotiana sylvestris TaxID=4096 RepID=UPI00388CC66F
MVEGSRQWHEKLPFMLLGYHTTVRTSVRATPYLLVYGTEAVIPTEIEILSIRIVAEAEIDDVEWVKTRLEQLSLIDKKRLEADNRLMTVKGSLSSSRLFEFMQFLPKQGFELFWYTVPLDSSSTLLLVTVAGFLIISLSFSSHFQVPKRVIKEK